MPTFPTYGGELPACLNPRNPRHYWLLIYWVFFRPTALKCYLYQANPKLYRAEWGTVRMWDVPAYRNLYLMMFLTVPLLSVFVVLPIVLIVSWFQWTPVRLLGLLEGVALGVVVSAAVGVPFGVNEDLAFGMRESVGEGMGEGMARSVARGIVLGVAVSVVFGVVFGLAIGIGVTFGMVFVVTVGVAFGVTFGVTGGVTEGVAGGIAVGVTGGMAFGVAVGVAGDMAQGVAFGVAFVLGSLRIIPFYPFQLLQASLWAKQKRNHPLAWDELLVLPLPNSPQILAYRLQKDEMDGLHLAAKVARNPFQRWVAQRALQSHLHNQAAPLHLFYTMLAYPILNQYVFAPIVKQHWERLPATKQLLLGELTRRWVDCSSSNFIVRLSERLVWGLTWFLRDHRQTPLTRFAGMLYDLLYAKTISVGDFDLSSYREIYTDLSDYPGGEEIAGSFEALAAFLSYKMLSELPSAAPLVSPLMSNEQSIRPMVLTALARLGEIGAEVAAYRDATSRVSQQGALLRATDGLDGLDEYVVGEVMAPEQTILRRVIRQWRRLVSEEGGEVGRAQEVAPIANPYVAGSPVTGTLFVGREDILRRLEELWAPAGLCPSVVIYGHRRMGKTSILHNLGARFGAHTTIVNFSMQLVGYVANTNELLLNLALAFYDSLLPTQQDELGEPEEERFLSHNPYTAFRRFLTQVERIRSEERFFITVDEFELIEEAISEGRLEARLLDFWRGIIQTYPWFVMVFAGLHTLQEMTTDYWNPLFGSVTTIPVSFLRPAAAQRLITQPTPDFPLDYDADAIEQIIRLTNGQPYLIQLICHGLVTRFNRQTFEEGLKQPRRFTLTDVEAIINAPEFYRDGIHYFAGVWSQVKNSPTQIAILNALAPSPTGLSLDLIAQKSALTPQESRRALEILAQHDIVSQQDEHWHFTVELMRRWVVMRRR